MPTISDRKAPSMLRRTAATSTFAAILALGLSGCGGVTVSQETVEKTVSERLEAQVGQKPDKIECPGDLSAKVGETMKCTLTAGSDDLGVDVQVTEVDGTDVKFDIQVDEQ
ncbi:DUF4333 domain-containing protein [Nocardioides sp. NPDC006273]|uniref:DUF4333 domain-containing protein n=1 Tax=Nocardioides sp. NPDC006273 TaxID=3155598 RepID=UPI00339DB3E5